MIKDIRLELKTWGTIFDWGVILENKHEIGHWNTDVKKKVLFKDLPQFPIEGDSLELELWVKGVNGASATLTVYIDNDNEPIDPSLEAVVVNGRTVAKHSIIV